MPSTIPSFSIVADSAEATGLKWAAPAGGGKVLQVVYASTTTEVFNTTQTFSDSNLSATITPTSATSKILVLVNQNVAKVAGNANNAVKLRLMRGGTAILDPITTQEKYTGSSLENVGSVGTSYLDAPSTTSATTYKTQFANNTTASAVYAQYNNNNTSTITLMEIGA